MVCRCSPACSSTWLKQHSGRQGLRLRASRATDGLARDVRPVPIKVITVAKGNNKGALHCVADIANGDCQAALD